MKQPKQLLSGTTVNNWGSCATSYWVENDTYCGPITINWFGCGWVCQMQESYLSKTGVFKHKNDIPGFNHSNTPLSNSPKDWEHIYETPEQALIDYRKFIKKKLVVEISYDIEPRIIELTNKLNGYTRTNGTINTALHNDMSEELKKLEVVQNTFLDNAKYLVNILKKDDYVITVNKEGHTYAGEFMEKLDNSGARFKIYHKFKGSMIIETHMLSKIETPIV